MAEQKPSSVYPPPTRPQPTDPEANEMYPLSTHLAPTFAQREQDLANVLGETTEQRATREKDFLDTLRPLGDLARAIGPLVVDLAVEAELAAARGSDEDEDQRASRIQQQNEEVRQELASVYGREESERLLARAQKFVKQHPKFNALLGSAGIGSKPSIVIPVIEHIRRIGWKG